MFGPTIRPLLEEVDKNWRDSSYLEEAEKWLVQLISTQESTSSFTKYLFRQVQSELSKIK